jgi:hypothetical protein
VEPAIRPDTSGTLPAITSPQTRSTSSCSSRSSAGPSLASMFMAIAAGFWPAIQRMYERRDVQSIE